MQMDTLQARIHEQSVLRTRVTKRIAMNSSMEMIRVSQNLVAVLGHRFFSIDNILAPPACKTLEFFGFDCWGCTRCESNYMANGADSLDILLFQNFNRTESILFTFDSIIFSTAFKNNTCVDICTRSSVQPNYCKSQFRFCWLVYTTCRQHFLRIAH